MLISNTRKIKTKKRGERERKKKEKKFLFNNEMLESILNVCLRNKKKEEGKDKLAFIVGFTVLIVVVVGVVVRIVGVVLEVVVQVFLVFVVFFVVVVVLIGAVHKFTLGGRRGVLLEGVF